MRTRLLQCFKGSGAFSICLHVRRGIAVAFTFNGTPGINQRGAKDKFKADLQEQQS